MIKAYDSLVLQEGKEMWKDSKAWKMMEFSENGKYDKGTGKC